MHEGRLRAEYARIHGIPEVWIPTPFQARELTPKPSSTKGSYVVWHAPKMVFVPSTSERVIHRSFDVALRLQRMYDLDLSSLVALLDDSDRAAARWCTETLVIAAGSSDLASINKLLSKLTKLQDISKGISQGTLDLLSGELKALLSTVQHFDAKRLCESQIRMGYPLRPGSGRKTNATIQTTHAIDLLLGSWVDRTGREVKAEFSAGSVHNFYDETLKLIAGQLRIELALPDASKFATNWIPTRFSLEVRSALKLGLERYQSRPG